MSEKVKIGLLGSGFVANFYMEGLKDVPGHEVVLNTDKDIEAANDFAKKWDIPNPMDSIDRAIARDDIDLYLIALPNFLHEEVVLKLSEAEKNMVCTKPLGRNAEEAQNMLNVVREAGVFNGYAETEVFAPAVVKARRMIKGGGLGKLNWVRSREAHPGPHADWFWNGDLAGGGALLDMGPHCVEAARYFYGKDDKITEVFAWGENLVHTDRTDQEDNALLVMRLESGGIAHVEVSWSSRGGLDLRNEIYGTEGSTFTDVTRSTPISAFTRSEADYIVEKAELDQGWVFPLPEEAFAYGYQAEMKHFVNCVKEGKEPREDFEDGYVVNKVLDAAYRSMKEKAWQKVDY